MYHFIFQMPSPSRS